MTWPKSKYFKSLGRRWNRVLPLVMTLALLTPLAHWLTKDDDDLFLDDPRILKYKDEKLPLIGRETQELIHNDEVRLKDWRPQIPKQVNKILPAETDPPRKQEPEVRPTEVRKSVVIHFGSFPLQDDMIQVVGAKRPNKAYLTIGVPTVYRKLAGSQYLIQTIKSLIDNMDPEEELPEVVILVFAADEDIRLRQEVVNQVKAVYGAQLGSGLIQVLTVDKEAYPPLDGLKRNYDDPDDRVRWRAKQVVDFAFMFHYARNLSEYYLQIEDDVLSSPHFISVIKAFVSSQVHHWVTLDFSTLGFIGKLIRSSDLEEFARFLLMFYDEQPVDYLYTLFMKILVQDHPILHRPTLFQHFGEHSSLAGKAPMGMYKDKFFALGREARLPVFSIMVNTTKNPAAQILTSMQSYTNFAPETPYGDITGYFWGKTPRHNDFYMVIFQKPQRLKSVFIQTGRETQQNDFLRQGVLEVSPAKNASDPKSHGNDKVYISEDFKEATERRCNTFTKVGEFDKGVVFVNNLDTRIMFGVKCVRMRVTQEQEEWIIVNDIRIKTLDPSS